MYPSNVRGREGFRWRWLRGMRMAGGHRVFSKCSLQENIFTMGAFSGATARTGKFVSVLQFAPSWRVFAYAPALRTNLGWTVVLGSGFWVLGRAWHAGPQCAAGDKRTGIAARSGHATLTSDARTPNRDGRLCPVRAGGCANFSSSDPAQGASAHALSAAILTRDPERRGDAMPTVSSRRAPAVR